MLDQQKLNIIYLVLGMFLIGIIIYLVVSGGGLGGNNLLKQYPWTVPKSPSIKDKIVVYVSSGLFNLYEILYSIGIKNVADTSQAASVFSDHTPSIYEAAKDYKQNDSFFSKNGQANFVINTMMGWVLDIPEGGMAEILAKKDPNMYMKDNGWECYIPARDGFNMAFFMGATSKVTLKDIQKYFPDMTAELWAGRGTNLLEAVYGFDMYNLIARCNVCIFNANGIAMDDGSCVELGICTTRGYPCVIHRDQLTSNFPNGVINPMVAGAAGYQLGGYTLTHPDISSSVEFMDEVLKSITSGKNEQIDYAHNIPPPKLVSYWCNVGEVVWEWKYTSDPSHYVIKEDGTLDPSSYSDDYNKFISGVGGDLGKALVVAKIIFLIRDVKEKYGIIKAPAHMLRMTHQNDEQRKLSMPKESPLSFANTMGRIYNNSVIT